jgi:hypothetical protein
VGTQELPIWYLFVLFSRRSSAFTYSTCVCCITDYRKAVINNRYREVSLKSSFHGHRNRPTGYWTEHRLASSHCNRNAGTRNLNLRRTSKRPSIGFHPYVDFESATRSLHTVLPTSLCSYMRSRLGIGISFCVECCRSFAWQR